jgi:thiol-disulfide isomerase/thioredoxin
VQRTVLFEQFTSNTCVPCASAAPVINNILNANNVNTPNGKVVSLLNIIKTSLHRAMTKHIPQKVTPEENIMEFREYRQP